LMLVSLDQSILIVCAGACVQCNPTTSLAAVQHALINYLKMAPYRQGGAGKDAALDADSDVELDRDDQPDLLTVWVPNHQGNWKMSRNLICQESQGKCKISWKIGEK